MSFASAINLFEIEQLAQGRLSTMARDYYASGANDAITLARNREAMALSGCASVDEIGPDLDLSENDAGAVVGSSGTE